LKKESFALEMLRELIKVACPEGMTSHDIVRQAIEFKDPPRIPYSFVYHPPATDIAFTGSIDQVPAKKKMKLGDHYVDSWGVIRVRIYDVKKFDGGFIARHYPSPWDIDLSIKRQKVTHDSFIENGCGITYPIPG